MIGLKKYKDQPDRTIPVKYREEYQNFIEKQLPKLFELVNYRHYEFDEESTDAAPAGGARPGMAGGMVTGQDVGKLVGVVDWSEANRSELMVQYDFTRRPSSSQVRLAQEDYWVYQALLNIIKSTNGDATTHSSAAVKEIETLQIGQQAVATLQSDQGADLLSVGANSMSAGGAGGMPGMSMGGMPGGGMMGEMGGMPGGGMMSPGGMPGGGMMSPGGMPGEMGGMPGGGMMSPGGMPGEMGGMSGGGMDMSGGGMDMGGGAPLSAEDMALLNYRYVKESLEPLPAGQNEYAEFKMMPIFMRLKIDQRKIPDFLVECANSTMPVEVKRFRINPESGGGSLSMGRGGGMPKMGGAMMGGGMPGMMGPGGGMPGEGMMMGGGARRGAAAMGGTTGAEEKNPYVVSVEIRGIIYLYNLPDKSKLATGMGSEQGDADAMATPDGTAPADGTVPAGGATTPVDGTTPAGTPAPAVGTSPAGAPGAFPAGGAPGTPPGGAAVPPGAAPTGP